MILQIDTDRKIMTTPGQPDIPIPPKLLAQIQRVAASPDNAATPQLGNPSSQQDQQDSTDIPDQQQMWSDESNARMRRRTVIAHMG